MVISKCMRALVKIFNDLMGIKGDDFPKPPSIKRSNSVIINSTEVNFSVVAQVLRKRDPLPETGVE
jgi:hypothetical protein